MHSLIRLASDVMPTVWILKPKCRVVSIVRYKSCDLGSEVKYNYPKECEMAINQQIHEELNAFYGYQAMAAFFQHPDIALHGFHEMFHLFSKEETEHALKLMAFQNMRGGKVTFEDLKAPEPREWDPECAVKEAIRMEKHVTSSLHKVHSVASDQRDLYTCDFIESEYLKEQYKALAELQELLSKIRRVGKGVGIYLLDKELIKGFRNKEI